MTGDQMKSVLEKIKAVEKHLNVSMIRTRDVFCAGDAGKIANALRDDMAAIEDRYSEAERDVQGIIKELQGANG